MSSHMSQDRITISNAPTIPMPAKANAVIEPVRALLDPQGRGQPFQLAGSRAGGFVLTRQEAPGKWGAATYSLIRTWSRHRAAVHRDHRDRARCPLWYPCFPAPLQTTKIAVPVNPRRPTLIPYCHLDSGRTRRWPRPDAGEGSWKMGRYDVRHYHGPAVSTVTRRSCGNAAPRSNALLRT
jgi:hypothetical protein